MNLGDKQKEIMKDVAHIQADGQGFWFINLFGEREFVEGSIQSVDLVDQHLVILTKESTN
jgi:predicted RNA-binding protein